MKVKCDYCGKEFDRPNWETRKNVARGQTKIFCSYECHHKSMMSPICKDNKIVNELFLENKSLIKKIILRWQHKLSDKRFADRIEAKAYLATSQFPLIDAYNLPSERRKMVFNSYINTACKHAFMDILRYENKTISFDRVENKLCGG